jgi:thiamine biosynthesis protein ThiC
MESSLRPSQREFAGKPTGFAIKRAAPAGGLTRFLQPRCDLDRSAARYKVRWSGQMNLNLTPETAGRLPGRAVPLFYL